MVTVEVFRESPSVFQIPCSFSCSFFATTVAGETTENRFWTSDNTATATDAIWDFNLVHVLWEGAEDLGASLESDHDLIGKGCLNFRHLPMSPAQMFLSVPNHRTLPAQTGDIVYITHRPHSHLSSVFSPNYVHDVD
nr:hypothetical protein Iba_chr03eCG10270 [Ipomoea batatas]